MVTFPSLMRSQKIVFIIVWNMAGELVSLKNMIVGSYRPSLIIKATFHQSFSLIRTLLYPHSMSNPVNKVQLYSQSVSCGIRGRGYRFLMVNVLTGW